MRKIALPLFSLILIGASPAEEAQEQVISTMTRPAFVEALPLRDDLYNFAADLNMRSWRDIGGSGTPLERKHVLLERLSNAGPVQRQKARWNYARYLIDVDLPLEATAVLAAMLEDEPLLEDNASFRAVQGIAYIKGSRYREGIQALTLPSLLAKPEACLWRAYAHANSGNPGAAIVSWPCAVEAANKAAVDERTRLALPVVRAAYLTDQLSIGKNILDRLPHSNVEATFWRGMYALERGEMDLAQRLLADVRDRNAHLLSYRAELELVKAQHHANIIPTEEAIERLEAMRFAWRGRGFEQDLLLELGELHKSLGNIRGALTATAPRLRYLDIGAATSGEIKRAHELLQAALGPDSELSLADQAGIYWDFRDLAPQGLYGDNMIRDLAQQIAASGLHQRAADLLERQIDARLNDAEASVAVQVAQWRLFSGEPQKAVEILDRTENTALAADVRQKRQLLYIYALLALQRGAEAIALVDGNAENLPDALRAELYWQGREYPKYVRLTRSLLPTSGLPTTEQRAMIIRQAIAANIARDDTEVARLAARYGAYFEDPTTPFASAFHLLTGGQVVSTPTIDRALADVEKAAPTNTILGWISALGPAKEVTEG